MNFPATSDGFTGNPFATRGDWIRALASLVEPAAARLRPETADLHLPGGVAQYGGNAARLERFARVLLPTALLAHATKNASILAPFARALAVGVDRNSPHAWGFPGDRDQRVVEMCFVAQALAIAPRELWESQPPECRSALAEWLASVNRVELPPNNWVLFRLLVNAVLCQLGVPPEGMRDAEDWAVVDEHYVGGGWYNDGPMEKARAFDYYNAFGFHLFGLLVACLHPAIEPARRASVHERAAEFCRVMSALQSREGLHLPYGRSLAYRFAPAAFAGACALAGVGDAAQSRESAARCLRYWGRQDFLDGGGLLSVGFVYPNMQFAENYVAPGGPYFALQAFLPLWLDAEHAFWKASVDAAAPPPEPRRVLLAEAGMTVVEERAHHRAVFAGQRTAWPLRHEGEKYAKFAYSSRHGFQVTGGWHGLNRLGFDSSAAISDDGDVWRLRERPEDCRLLDGGAAFSRWIVPGWIEVESTVDDLDGVQVRRHTLRVLRSLHWLEGGWPFPVREPVARSDGRLEEARAGSALVWRPGTAWFSGIFSAGSVAGQCGLVCCEPNLNVLHPLTVLPYFREILEPGRYERVLFVGGYGHSPESWRECVETWRRIV